jgi:hypothetical protein
MTIIMVIINIDISESINLGPPLLLVSYSSPDEQVMWEIYDIPNTRTPYISL